MNQYFTGSDRFGLRPVIGNWQLDSSKKNDYVQFNTTAITLPSRPSVGLESGFNQWCTDDVLVER